MKIEMARKDWINEYGYNEGYIWKKLESFYSNHLHRGSSMETCYDCGNCDGGRCHGCAEMYEVTEYGHPVDDSEGLFLLTPEIKSKTFLTYLEAKEFYDSIE